MYLRPFSIPVASITLSRPFSFPRLHFLFFFLFLITSSRIIQASGFLRLTITITTQISHVPNSTWIIIQLFQDFTWITTQIELTRIYNHKLARNGRIYDDRFTRNKTWTRVEHHHPVTHSLWLWPSAPTHTGEGPRLQLEWPAPVLADSGPHDPLLSHQRPGKAHACGGGGQPLRSLVVVPAAPMAWELGSAFALSKLRPAILERKRSMGWALAHKRWEERVKERNGIRMWDGWS
jgi:hypothetical protein